MSDFVDVEFEALKDDFLSAVGHELRTPLTVIQAALKLLRGVGGDLSGDQARRLLDKAVSNSDRLQKQVEGLLDVRKLRSGRITLNKEQCDLAGLLEAARQRVLGVLGTRVLSVVAPAGRLWVDAARMTDVLVALLDNAIRYSADGTSIHLAVKREAGFVTFAVQDQGIGLEATQLERIFDDFYQLDRSDTRRPGGSGLSLGICRHIVRQHGGRIWAESVPATGSTFFFILPAPHEQALFENTESFRQLVENIRDVFWMVDPEQHKMLYVSPAYEEVWGRPRDSLYADPISWLTSIHEDDRERVRTANEAQLRQPYRVEYRVVRPDGSVRWVRDRSYPVRNELGEVTNVVGIAEDITAQHDVQAAMARLNLELEQRVDERTAEFRTIFESTPQAIVFTDAERRIRMCNSAFCALLGYEPAEIVGQSVRLSYISVEAFEEQGRVRFNAQPDRSVSHFEMMCRHKNGEEIPVEVTAARVFSTDGSYLGGLSITRDLRPQRRVEQQVRQAQKLEATGQLAGGIAHDFNNLLTVISGYTLLLQADMDLRDPRRELLAEIMAATDRATAMTGQLLTFSRRQVVRPETLDLGTVVTYSRSLLQRMVGEDVQLSIREATEPLPVKADRGHIEQILMNLASNARDAMPSGGTLEIATSPVILHETRTMQSVLLEPGRYAVLQVSDNGRGMDPATVARLFEPFFSTKPPGQGTGLGLATIYGIVSEGRGGIEVDTRPGAGTSFRIYLPQCDEAGLESVQPAPSVGAGETILLVEDEAAVRKLVRRVLENAGYKVIEAADGVSAVGVLETGQPIDLVVTDVVMPGLSGQELAERIQETHPAARILFMSGYMDDRVAHCGVERPDVHFVRKPLIMSMFLNKVREVLET